MITSSAVPLRVEGLFLLFEHQQDQRFREEAKQLYMGNTLYSLLGSLHAMNGSELKAPSYGDFLKSLDGKAQKSASVMTNTETWQAAIDMLGMFAPKDVNDG